MKIESILCVDGVVSVKDISERWGGVDVELLYPGNLSVENERFDIVIFPFSKEFECRNKAKKFLIATGDELELQKQGYRISKNIFSNRVVGIKSVWKLDDFDWSGSFSFSLDWTLLEKKCKELDPIFKQTLSAHVVVHNELDWIGFCLASLVWGGVDEIVVVDTESTDGTWEIIQKFEEWCRLEVRVVKMKIFRVPNDPKNFYKIRNFAIENCTGDWLLLVDGDEVYPKVSIDRIKQLIIWNPFNVNSYRFPDYQITYNWKTIDKIGRKSGYDRLYKNYIGYHWRGGWPAERPYIGETLYHIKSLHIQDIYYCHFAHWKSWDCHLGRWECLMGKSISAITKEEINKVREKIMNSVWHESKGMVEFPKEMIPEIFNKENLEPWMIELLKLPESISV